MRMSSRLTCDSGWESAAWPTWPSIRKTSTSRRSIRRTYSRLTRRGWGSGAVRCCASTCLCLCFCWCFFWFGGCLTARTGPPPPKRSTSCARVSCSRCGEGGWRDGPALVSAGGVVTLLLDGRQRLGRLIGNGVAPKRAQGFFNLLPRRQLKRIDPTTGHDEQQGLLDPGADGTQFS